MLAKNCEHEIKHLGTIPISDRMVDRIGRPGSSPLVLVSEFGNATAVSHIFLSIKTTIFSLSPPESLPASIVVSNLYVSPDMIHINYI